MRAHGLELWFRLAGKIFWLFSDALVVITRHSFKRFFTKICKMLPKDVVSDHIIYLLVYLFICLFVWALQKNSLICLLDFYKLLLKKTLSTTWMYNKFIIFRNVTEPNFIKNLLSIRGLGWPYLRWPAPSCVNIFSQSAHLLKVEKH